MNNIKNIAVGNKFSTENKLIRAFGMLPQKGKRNREYQLREIRRFLSYEKTGKINPKTHKPSNEIVVTEIYGEPNEKVSVGRPQGAYDELTLAMLEWLRSYCCSNGLKSVKELLKDARIVDSTDILNTYVKMSVWVQMSKDEKRIAKCKKEYIHGLTDDFKKKVLSVLGYLKKEVPTLEYSRSYKITFDKERAFWQEATNEQIEIITDEIKSCQRAIEIKYSKKFNQLKHDEMVFDEYNELLSDSLLSILGIYGHVWAVKIVRNDELCERYNDPEYIYTLDDKVYPIIKGFYKGKMIDVIEKSGYISKSTGQYIFKLAFCKEVIDFHKSIFGEYNFENDEIIDSIRRFKLKKEMNHISKAEDDASNPFKNDIVVESIEPAEQAKMDNDIYAFDADAFGSDIEIDLDEIAEKMPHYDRTSIFDEFPF